MEPHDSIGESQKHEIVVSKLEELYIKYVKIWLDGVQVWGCLKSL